MNKCGLALLVVPLISSVAAAVQPITAIYYTSTPQSYIGGGETLLLTPPQDGITSGFSFLPNSAYVNTVDIRASDGRFDWWANFVGPNHTQVTVGSYSFTIG